MTPSQANYVDLLTRHLQAKRDYPFMLCDEPEFPQRNMWFDKDFQKLREQTIRDFERTF